MKKNNRYYIQRCAAVAHLSQHTEFQKSNRLKHSLSLLNATFEYEFINLYVIFSGSFQEDHSFMPPHTWTYEDLLSLTANAAPLLLLLLPAPKQVSKVI